MFLPVPDGWDVARVILVVFKGSWRSMRSNRAESPTPMWSKLLGLLQTRVHGENQLKNLSVALANILGNIKALGNVQQWEMGWPGNNSQKEAEREQDSTENPSALTWGYQNCSLEASPPRWMLSAPGTVL